LAAAGRITREAALAATTKVDELQDLLETLNIWQGKGRERALTAAW
jgi:hypothetical protein